MWVHFIKITSSSLYGRIIPEFTVISIFHPQMHSMHKMGKKLVAAYPLKTGQVLRSGDVAIRSPGDGLAPFELDNVLGKTVTRDLEQDENITFEILE